MNRWLIAVIMGTAISGTAPSKGQEASVADDRVRRLLSDNGNVRAQARRELRQERNDTIAWLASAIEERAQRTSQYRFVEDAMSVLGDTRAPEAIDVLIKHIGYPRTAEIDDRVTISPTAISIGDSGLPAIDALVRIGEPCVDPVITKIRTTDQKVELMACVGVLKRLKIPFIRERLETAVTVADGPEKAAMKEALQLFDEWIPPKERVEKLQRKLGEFFEKNQRRQ